MDTWTGPEWSTFATRTFHFDSKLQNVWDCCASVSQNCSLWGFLFFFVFLFWLSDYKDELQHQRGINLTKKSAWRCYSICLLFSKNKNNKKKTNLSRKEQAKGIKRQFVLCEDFSGTPSCLSLHCFDCFCTVYTCVGECVCVTESACVECMCVCMYRHSISDLSAPLNPTFIGGGRPPKILYCLPLVGYSNFSLF